MRQPKQIGARLYGQSRPQEGTLDSRYPPRNPAVQTCATSRMMPPAWSRNTH